MPEPEAQTGDVDLAPEPARMHGALLTESRGESVLHTDRDRYAELVTNLYDDGYRVCVDLTGVDYLLHDGRIVPEGVSLERFEVVLNLLSVEERRRLRVRVQVPETDPVLESVFALHPGTEAMERETYDMFGIIFTGHPDLTRILMPDDWEGHPLRKDFGIGRIPVQFKGAPAPR